MGAPRAKTGHLQRVGVYLYGSLVSGDFDEKPSDVDLTAALRDNLTDADLDTLRSMHQNMVATFPHWDNRVEVAYITLHALRHFKSEYEYTPARRTRL
jgi:predicted nucleotidyltransferase